MLTKFRSTKEGWVCNMQTTIKMEKIGGLPVYPQEYEDFYFCVNSCELVNVNFKRSPFTWWNGRIDNDCIFKRLDKLLVNHNFLSSFASKELEHLARIGSDHAPLLISCGNQSSTLRKPFRFLNF